MLNFFRQGRKLKVEFLEGAKMPQNIHQQKHYEELRGNQTLRRCVEIADNREEALRLVKTRLFAHEERAEREGNQEWVLWNEGILRAVINEVWKERESSFCGLVVEASDVW